MHILTSIHVPLHTDTLFYGYSLRHSPLTLTINNSHFSFSLEHEACAIDINELRWHCAYQGRIEARISERVHHAGTTLVTIIYGVAFLKLTILYLCLNLIIPPCVLERYTIIRKALPILVWE